MYQILVWYSDVLYTSQVLGVVRNCIKSMFLLILLNLSPYKSPFEQYYPKSVTITDSLIISLPKNGSRQANLVFIAYASSEGLGEPAHPRSLARTFAARSYKQWIKRNLQTESQILDPSDWLGMRS